MSTVTYIAKRVTNQLTNQFANQHKHQSKSAMNTLSPSTMTSSVMATNFMTAGRTLRAYLIEAKYELLRMIRTPAYAFPALLMPVLLYLLFSIVVVGPNAVNQPKLPIFMFAAFSVFALTSPGMYGLGQAFAVERQSGVLMLKRTQPMPVGGYLIAKILTALVSVTISMSALIMLANSFGHVALSAAQALQIMATSLLGMATFCAIGLFIGSLVSGTAAGGVVNAIYFPMMYLSGTFFPLPDSLAPWAMVWPTFYLDQIFFAILFGKSAISVPMCVAVLTGLLVFFAGAASRRLARAADNK